MFCAAVWGATFVASKRLLSVYTPVQLMFMRFVIAYAVMWLICPCRERTSRKEELLYFTMGLSGCTLYFWLENTALTITSTANVSTIVALAPILTALMTHIGGRETAPLGRWVWIGFAMALAGVVLVVFNGAFVLKLNPAGDLLALATAFIWGFYCLFQERALERRDSLFITRKVMFYSLITCLPLMLAGGFEGFSLRPLLASWIDPVCLLFLAVVGSALCYLAWCTAEAELGAVTTSSYIYAIPFVTLVASAIFLREPITPMGVLGAVLIVAGVWVSSRRTT